MSEEALTSFYRYVMYATTLWVRHC